MKTKYKGFTIEIKTINEDRVEYKVLKPDGTLLDDSEGFDVTTEQALSSCKAEIDWYLDET